MSNSSEAKKLYEVAPLMPTDLDLDEAKKLFDDYKERGVIRTGVFEDNTWYTTNEYENVGLHFIFSEIGYARWYKGLFDMDLDEFIDYLKVYLVSSFNSHVLTSNRELIYDIRKVISTDPEDLLKADSILTIQAPFRINDFFACLPVPLDNKPFEDFLDIMESLTEMMVTNNMSAGNRRALAPFDSYLLFDDIMKDWWESKPPLAEKLFYMPLYLFWQTCSVIPQRPREFLLTRRDCLLHKDDGWYIRLKHSMLKGAARPVTNTIDGDYYEDEIKVPDDLAAAYLEYINLTKECESTDLNTLFPTNPHYRKWKQRKHENSRFLTYVNMNCILRYFYDEIIEGRYGLRTVYDRTEQHNQPNEINYIHLGDARHLALINAVLSGVTPETAMLMAGHVNVETTGHYYSNISQMIDCRVYAQHRKLLKGDREYSLGRFTQPPLNISTYTRLENKDLCYSQDYARGDYSYCEQIIGPHGEIGYCENCTYHRRSNNLDFFEDANKYKKKIDSDCRHLSDVISRVRRMQGEPEDVLQAFLQLSTSANTYQAFLEEKYRQGRGDS